MASLDAIISDFVISAAVVVVVVAAAVDCCAPDDVADDAAAVAVDSAADAAAAAAADDVGAAVAAAVAAADAVGAAGAAAVAAAAANAAADCILRSCDSPVIWSTDAAVAACCDDAADDDAAVDDATAVGVTAVVFDGGVLAFPPFVWLVCPSVSPLFPFTVNKDKVERVEGKRIEEGLDTGVGPTDSEGWSNET